MLVRDLIEKSLRNDIYLSRLSDKLRDGDEEITVLEFQKFYEALDNENISNRDKIVCLKELLIYSELVKDNGDISVDKKSIKESVSNVKSKKLGDLMESI